MGDTKSNPPSQNSAAARVTFLEGRGELPMLEITTARSAAEIYLHGAHVTHFKKNGEPPLLFLSQCSRFAAGQPIRGGIPVIFPWFGPRNDLGGLHGFARVKTWTVKEIAPAPDGSVTVRLRMPDCLDAPGCRPCAVEYVVTVNDSLTAELIVSNESSDAFEFETCLHTYFNVGDIDDVSIVGLKGVDYLDKVEAFKRKREKNDSIGIASEVDRVYLDTRQTVEIRDGALKRIIRVDKENSASTVVWNPWIAKAKAMADFGDEEYKQMVCVESGNVMENKIKSPPGQTTSLKVTFSSMPLE